MSDGDLIALSAAAGGGDPIADALLSGMAKLERKARREAFEEAAEMMEAARDVASNGQGCYDHAQYVAYKNAAEMLRARAAELAVETGE